MSNEIRKDIERRPCPHDDCGKALPMVRRGEYLHYDCPHCGRYGRINTSAGTLQEERCDLPSSRWWKIVKSGHP